MLPRREQANCGKDSELSALDQLKLYLDQCPLIAIIRGVTPAEAEAIGSAIFDAGIRIIEVPLNSPEPLKSIERLATKFGDQALVGAGTVFTPGNVEDVKAAGGRLIVSPHTNLGVVRAAAAANLVSCPGYFTPTEAFAALDAGATALKLFPAEGASPAVLKAQLAVIPKQVPIFVVGGITLDNMQPWRDAGAAGFGLGSGLYKPGQSAADTADRARAYVAGIGA
jgi:2-dehydro-3-deoxyphosphogalactonate aldolase